MKRILLVTLLLAALISLGWVAPEVITVATGWRSLIDADDGLTTQLLVGGGAGSAPVWTAATGTDAPVRAGSPTLTGTPLVGTTAAGGNLTINATEGSNIVADGTFTAADGALPASWAGANWAISSNTALHTAGATTALTQAAATVVASPPTTYKLTFDVVGGTAGTITPSAGGCTMTARAFGSASYTSYFTATETTALAFTPTSAFDGALDNVVLVAYTNDTGDLTVRGNLTVTSPIKDSQGTDVMSVWQEKVGIGIKNAVAPLHIIKSTTGQQTLLKIDNSHAGANDEASIDFGISGASTVQARMSVVRTNIPNCGDADIYFKTSSNAEVRISATGSLGINTTGPDRKLDVLDASSPQIRATQADGTVYTDMQTDSSGYFTLSPTGNQIGMASAANGGRWDVQCLTQTVTIAAAASSGATSTITIPAGAVVENITWRVTQAAGGGPTAMNIYYTEDANDMDCLCDNSAITLSTTGDVYTKGDLTYTGPRMLHRTEAYTLTVQLTNGSDVATNVTGASFIIRLQAWIKKFTAPTS